MAILVIVLCALAATGGYLFSQFRWCGFMARGFYELSQIAQHRPVNAEDVCRVFGADR
jgi:hypothetical protein